MKFHHIIFLYKIIAFWILFKNLFLQPNIECFIFSYYISFCWFRPIFQPVKIILTLAPVFCYVRYCFQLCGTCKFDKVLNVEWERTFFQVQLESKVTFHLLFLRISWETKSDSLLKSVAQWTICGSALFYSLRALFLRFDITFLSSLLTPCVHWLLF